MSFTSDLDKIRTIDEAQILFEKEVARISEMRLYRNSKLKFDARVLRIQNDIYNYMNLHGIEGVLYFYDYMGVHSDKFKHSINEYTFEDSLFFKRLWLFLLVYGILFTSFVFIATPDLLQYFRPVSRETKFVEKEKLDKISKKDVKESNKEDEEEMVYNKYRGQKTTKKTLNEDENWESIQKNSQKRN